MSARTQQLKKDCIIKTHKLVSRGLNEEKGVKEGSPFREGMEVGLCLDRARLITEGYKQNDHEPYVIKRAKALAHILENMAIYILPNELIVGNYASAPNKVAHYPDLQWRWLEKTICTPGGPYEQLLSENEKKEMIELHKYWQPRSVHGMERKILPDEAKKFFYYQGLSLFTYNWEMGTPNYEKIFSLGLNGIIKEIDERLKEINDEYMELKNPDTFLAQSRDLQAMKIALQGAITWGQRFSELAKEMALEEKDEDRKKELEQISKTCAWVPANPPRTSREALQCFWLIHLITGYIDEPHVGCGVRLDKILGTLYQKDLKTGITSSEETQELLECLWIKFLETGFLHPPIWTASGGGGLGWQTLTIGGVDAAGKDVTNEITYLILASMEALNTLQPPLAMRVHENTPKDLLVKATDVLSSGVSQPAMFNDKAVIPRLVNLGVPEEEARDYAISNCMWPVIPGKNIVHRSSNGGVVLMPKCLELALNQGKDMRTGKQLSVVTKNPLEFKSIEEVVDAVIEHYKYAANGLYSVANMANKLYEEYLQRPFLSGIIDGCIERAQELRKWTYMPYNDLATVGITNTGDSLASLKKLIFDEKKVPMEKMLFALKNNWKGAEDLREMCLKVSKFGNDDDYSDNLTVDLFERVAKEVKEMKSYISGKIYPGIVDGSAATAHYGFSGETSATPDGRMDGEPFADGTVSPATGFDKKGPTAALLSVAKIKPSKTWNPLFNQSFSPPFLKGEFVDRFADYLRTWAELGIHHIQFSVVTPEDFEAAQAEPEKYSELIVRVCGYSAYFIDLSKGLQDTVIERTSHSLAG